MPGGRATNLYSPCPPVTMERSSFDSLLEIATLAPLIALPLGSVTVPCRWNLPSKQGGRVGLGGMFGLRGGVFLTPQGSTGGRPAAQQNTPKPDSWLVYK